MSIPFNFSGSGDTYAPIWFKNLVLRIVTLNFYYPWAKANRLRYQFSHTEVAGSPLEFHGTGKQLFKGYIATLVVLAAAFGLAWYVSHALTEGSENPNAYVEYYSRLLILFLAPVYPLAIHGTMRYRLANITWRGIRMGYVGNLSELYVQFLIGIFFTIITFGIGASWMQARLRRYVVGHAQVGQVHLGFKGQGGDLFALYLGGFFLFLLTAGIYTPWYIRNLLRYQYNNIFFEENGEKYDFRTSITAWQCTKAFIFYPLITAITVGLASAWTWTAQLRILVDSLSLQGGFPIDTLVQVNPEYESAMGEDLASVLDVDFGL